MSAHKESANSTVDAALRELEQEPAVPEGETSLQLLQAIYKDKEQPLNVRVRCAIECLPFETPKLSATAITTMNGQSFAEALERAINQIELASAITQRTSAARIACRGIEKANAPLSE